MSTALILQIDSASSNSTELVAEQIGRCLKGGEVIELVSDLGGGKTTFMRGFAKGAGSTDHVSSPTFTISNVYQAKDLVLHHFDFYRLPEAGLIEYELHDVLGDPKAVVAVEWSNVIKHVLPQDRLTIHLKTTGDESRQLEFTYPLSLSYLVENL